MYIIWTVDRLEGFKSCCRNVVGYTHSFSGCIDHSGDHCCAFYAGSLMAEFQICAPRSSSLMHIFVSENFPSHFFLKVHGNFLRMLMFLTIPRLGLFDRAFDKHSRLSPAKLRRRRNSRKSGLKYCVYLCLASATKTKTDLY